MNTHLEKAIASLVFTTVIVLSTAFLMTLVPIEQRRYLTPILFPVIGSTLYGLYHLFKLPGKVN